MAFFHKTRRELLSKTLMNLVQICVGAAFAGNIFIKLIPAVKTLFAIGIVVLLALGLTVCPEKEE